MKKQGNLELINGFSNGDDAHEDERFQGFVYKEIERN